MIFKIGQTKNTPFASKWGVEKILKIISKYPLKKTITKNNGTHFPAPVLTVSGSMGIISAYAPQMSNSF